ncbi:MAG: ABC transporter permease [Bacteroidota bacterium]|nr:ABC transporter permease [Bacteroidota bacterium]
MVSVIGITVGTTALIVVLSVFNGFENVVISLFNSVNADIEITAKTGKTFNPNSKEFEKIRKIEGVNYISEVVEDNALVKYKDKQFIARIKGVGDNYRQINDLGSSVREGKYVLQNGQKDYALIGQGIAYNLDIRLNDIFTSLSVYAPKRTESKYLEAENAFNEDEIFPSGIFSVQQDFDSKYIIVPLRFARKLFDYQDEVSSIEIAVSGSNDKEMVKEEIKKELGSRYYVKNKYEQQELLFKIMKSEKWAVFLILTFILIVATFNMIGTLTMMIIDKQKDIFTLKSLGADSSVIRRIFFYEGMLVSLAGTIAGLALGYLICYLQIKFELVKIGTGGTFVVNAYPVKIQLQDFIYVTLTVLGIGLLASWYPSKYTTKKLERMVNVNG